jgi:hypothetical protein
LALVCEFFMEFLTVFVIHQMTQAPIDSKITYAGHSTVFKILLYRVHRHVFHIVQNNQDNNRLTHPLYYELGYMFQPIRSSSGLSIRITCL